LISSTKPIKDIIAEVRKSIDNAREHILYSYDLDNSKIIDISPSPLYNKSLINSY